MEQPLWFETGGAVLQSARERSARLLHEQRLGQTAGLRRTGRAMERQTTRQGKPTRITNGKFLQLSFWTLYCIVLVLKLINSSPTYFNSP